MKQEQTGHPTRHDRRSEARRRQLLYRRIGAGLIVTLAIVVFVFTFRVGLSPASLMWGSAGVLLLIEALLLAVDLPVSRVLQCVLGVACLALLVMGYMNHNYVRLDGRLVPRYAVLTQVKVDDEYPEHFEQMASLKKLDMRASTVTDFTPIYALSSLEQLDVRENYAFTRQEHDKLAEALPGCAIRWSVPVANAYFDSDAEAVNLTKLDMNAAQLRELFVTYPDKVFEYEVPLYGKRYAPDVQELDLRGQTADAEAIGEALALLPEVRSVDLRGAKTPPETVAALCDAHPAVHFMFTCDVPGGEMTTEDEAVTVTGTFDDLQAHLAYMDYMPNLKRIDANAIQLTDEQLDTIADAVRTGKLEYGLTVFGVPTSSLATELNLDNVKVPGVEAMEKVLARLPMLEKVSMCDCGLTEDQMGQLFDAHPNIKFIWWLEFGHYKLRTDATAFTTGLGTGNRYGYNDETFDCLRYCTDLMMLDLGHNHCTTLEPFRGLKKLRVLIMADNKLTDIAPISDFKDLEFCELFLNDITDLSPLTGLTHLVDLNVFYNPLYNNYKVLESMTWLQRLWIGGCRLSSSDVKELRAALPNTKINVEGRGSTGKGWRSHPHYDVLKQMYEEERYIPFEDSAPINE